MKYLSWIYNNIYLLTLCLAIVCSIPLILPYFHSGYFPTHDGEWAVVRLGDMFRELKDHQFPARYSGNLNFGYGYPLFEFAYPLPYYIGIIFHFLHVNFVTSVKLLFLLSVPLSFYGMFLLGYEVWGSRRGGFLSAMLYVYLPYRLVDLYVRGSIGESLSLALFPFILYFLFKLYRLRRVLFSILSGLGIACLIMTHNIMAVEFLPIVIIFMAVALVRNKVHRKELILLFLLTLGVGLGLSCFFWMPALIEKQLILLSVIPIADRNLYFVHPLQLLLPSWGYGTPTDPNPFTYQIGVPQILMLFLLFVAFIVYKRMQISIHFLSTLFISFSILLLIYLLLLFSFTAPIWNFLPLFKEINYPWTLLAVMGFLIAFLSGRLTAWKRGRLFTIIIAVLAVLYCLPYAHPSNFVDRGEDFYITNDATTTSSDEYMPLWVKQKPNQRMTTKFVALDNSIVLTNGFSNSKLFSVDTNATRSAVLQINTIYYPGWKATIDGKKTSIDYLDPQGVMHIRIPSGTHHINGTFTETSLRLIADSISFFTIIVILLVSGYRLRRK